MMLRPHSELDPASVSQPASAVSTPLPTDQRRTPQKPQVGGRCWTLDYYLGVSAPNLRGESKAKRKLKAEQSVLQEILGPIEKQASRFVPNLPLSFRAAVKTESSLEPLVFTIPTAEIKRKGNGLFFNITHAVPLIPPTEVRRGN